MKTLKAIFAALIMVAFLSLDSCGPVIISSRPAHPTPPWFYPNRVVNVRYVYFPEFSIYYDLTLRSYIYLNNGLWTTARTLPPRYSNINFRRTKQVRITNYFGDDIRTYHSGRRGDDGSRRTKSDSRRRRN